MSGEERNEKVIGELFSKTYLRSGEALNDSARARVRAHSFYEDRFSISVADFDTMLRVRIGVGLKGKGYKVHVKEFFENCATRDFLDLVTILYQCAHQNNPGLAKEWRNWIDRVFKDENLCYSLDEKCGVHYLVDENFQSILENTLSGLSSKRFAASQHSFTLCMEELSKTNPNFRHAIILLFDAIESAFKLIFGVSRIGSTEVEKYIKPKLDFEFEGANHASSKLLCDGFKDWINSVHNYRHADGSELPTVVPANLGVAIITTGCGYLRWILSIE